MVTNEVNPWPTLFTHVPRKPTFPASGLVRAILIPQLRSSSKPFGASSLPCITYPSMDSDTYAQQPCDITNRDSLNCQFTMEELISAVASTPSGKSQGPDGFTIKFYKTYTVWITSPLFKVFNSLRTLGFCLKLWKPIYLLFQRQVMTHHLFQLLSYFTYQR